MISSRIWKADFQLFKIEIFIQAALDFREIFPEVQGCFGVNSSAMNKGSHEVPESVLAQFYEGR